MSDGAEGSSNTDSVQSSRHSRRFMRRFMVAVASSLGALPVTGGAQSPSIDALQSAPTPQATLFEPSMRAGLEWTDNSGYRPRGEEQKDTVATVSGDIALRRLGPRLSVDGVLGFDALKYLDGTQRDRVLPRADVHASLEAVDDFFFLDANVFVGQTPIDPFDVRSGPSSTFNKLTTSQVELIPSLRGQIAENVTYQARSANLWTDSSQVAGVTNDGYFGDHSLVVERNPIPLGGFASVSRSTIKYDDQVTPALREDAARIGLNYALSPQLSLGVRGGYENVDGVVSTSGPIYGGQIEWRPTDRTILDGYIEDRYFGNSWSASFTHRRPRTAFELSTSRDVSTYADTFLALPATSNVAGLIDSALRTRIPDPTERNRVVRSVLDATGLSSAIGGPVSIYTERLLVRTRTSGTLTVLGVRNFLAVTSYYEQNRDLVSQVASDILPDLSVNNNNRQTGVMLNFSHQLAATTSIVASGDWSRIRGLDANMDERSTQQSARLELRQQLAPKSHVVLGYRYLNFESNFNSDSRENAVFAAVAHRF